MQFGGVLSALVNPDRQQAGAYKAASA